MNTGLSQENVTILELEAADGEEIRALARRAFPATQAGFVVPGKLGMVAADQGNIVAACLFKVLRLPSGGSVGFIAWLMTHLDFRGRGLAPTLLEASTRRLRDLNCGTVVTEIEGYNTASANTFLRAGYGRISLRQQCKRWPMPDLLRIWLRSGWLLDPGHFFWISDHEAPQPRPGSGWLAAVGGNTLLAVLAALFGGGLLRGAALSPPSLPETAACFFAVFTLLLAHAGGLWLVATASGLRLRYRPWAGGAGLSFLIALFFGAVMPLPGNFYPAGDGWDQRKLRQPFARGAGLSVFLILVAVLLGSWLRGQPAPWLGAAFGHTLLAVGKPLLIFNTLVAVAPFEGFHGRHLRDNNPRTWLLISGIAVWVVFAV